MKALILIPTLLLASFMSHAAFAQATDVTKDRRFNAVAWTQNAAEYSLATRQAYQLANRQLQSALEDETWSADEAQTQSGDFGGKPPSVILDLDETVLDNSAYNARGIVDGQTFNSTSWKAWIAEKKAKLIPGAAEFVAGATERGVKVFFITNRDDDAKHDTIENLNALGIPADESNVLAKNSGDGRPSDKISRRAAVAENHRILLLIGDNFADFCSEMDTEDGKIRNEIAGEKSRMLGHRWILIPNPMYGGWESALGNPKAALRLQRDAEAIQTDPHQLEKISTDFSDLTKVSGNTFLAVNDRKNGRDSGSRISLLTITDDGVDQTAIDVVDWKDADEMASDLEACCAIPNRPGEFLLAESGYYKGKYGRIFHVTLHINPDNEPIVTVNGVMKIYDRQLEQNEYTFDGDNVEGIDCFTAHGKTYLAYGERGGPTNGGLKLGTIIWGLIDLASYRFTKLGEAPLVSRSVIGDRDCSALHFVPQADQSISVLSVATYDPDTKTGPFRSVVYLAGCFLIDNNRQAVRFLRRTNPCCLAECPGLKVEGLAQPAALHGNASFSISTDDEILGGIWRPITVGNK